MPATITVVDNKTVIQVAGVAESNAAAIRAESARDEALTAASAAGAGRKFVTLTVVPNRDGTYNFSQGYIWRENNAGEPEFTIAPLNNAPALATAEAYIADPANMVGGQIVLQKFAIASGGAPAWQTGTAMVVLAFDALANLSAPSGVRLLRPTDRLYGSATAGVTGLNIFSPITDSQAVNFQFVRTTDAPSRTDVIHIDRVFLANSLGAAAASYIPGGEDEIAILLQGASDHMGGLSHGDQTITFSQIMMDDFRVTADGSLDGTEFRIIQRSTLTNPGTGAAAFYLDSEHIVRPGGVMRYRAILTANGAQTVDQGFIGMFKPDIAFLTQLFSEDPWQSSDLSVDLPAAIVSDGRKVIYRGSAGAVWASMELIRGLDRPNSHLRVEAAGGVRGKAYFDQTGPGYVFADGEKLQAEIEYRFGAS